MEEIADLKWANGPAMIRDENGQMNGYVLVDFDTSKVDVGTYVQHAKATIEKELKLPAGYSITWSGQYENMIRVKERLKIILPITLVLIFGLLYANTKSAFKASVVMLAVPFSAIGAQASPIASAAAMAPMPYTPIQRASGARGPSTWA